MSNQHQETKRKLWSLIESCSTATLITQSGEGFAHARTMECIYGKPGEELWFATTHQERKITEIIREPRVSLFYSYAQGQKGKGWICIYGVAEIVKDQKMKSKLWQAGWEKYWPEGATSQEYALIRVVPNSADYLLVGENVRGNLSFKNNAIT